MEINTKERKRKLYEVYTVVGNSARSPFVTLLSRSAQSGRSFGKRVWFTESHIVLIINLFAQFIVDKMKKKVML